MKKDTFRVALCGVISAFAFMLMLLTNLIPVGTYALPCIAGILLTAVVVEFGWKWALAAFAAVSLLSVFFAGDKEAVAYFAAANGACFIGRNGGDKFVAIFRDCTEKRLDSFLSSVSERTEEHNREKPEAPLRYCSGLAFREDGVQTLTELVALSDRRAWKQRG